MELLIIGAGAVGSVYGYLSGARVTYLIKPKHRAELEKGIQLYHWKGRKAESVHYTGFGLIDDATELLKRRFDAVLITLPSDKFRVEGWLSAFLKDFNVGSPDAKIWSLQPGPGDPEFLREKVGPGAQERIVHGQIPILSYLAPLPGESFPKAGYAFYLPPGAKAAWSSKNLAAAREAADLFTAGGLPSKVVDMGPPAASGVYSAALLRLLVAGLEKSEWSFDRLLNGENIYLVSAAIREMTAIDAKREKATDPSRTWIGKMASTPFGIKTAVRLAQKIMPLDFEAFMRVHFTKVAEQMHLTLDEFIDFGKRNGFSTTNLVLLRGRKKT